MSTHDEAAYIVLPLPHHFCFQYCTTVRAGCAVSVDLCHDANNMYVATRTMQQRACGKDQLPSELNFVEDSISRDSYKDLLACSGLFDMYELSNSSVS